MHSFSAILKMAADRWRRFGRPLVVALTLGLVSVTAIGPAGAEVVAVGEEGVGLLVSHRGNCYVVLPQHVHGHSTAVTVYTASPSAFGDAQVLIDLKSVYDLSVAYVSPGLEHRCTDRWDDIGADLSATLRDALANQTRATLVRVSSGGAVEQVPMRIASYTLDTFQATVEGETEIYKGSSGAILYLDGRPVGMAIRAADTEDGWFLRFDRIRADVDRLLDAQADGLVAVRAAASEAGAGACTSSVPIASVSCDQPPVAAKEGCSNIARGLPATFRAGHLPLTLEIAVEGDAPRPVSSVEITAARGEGYAVPKDVRATSKVTAGEGGSWLGFRAADMPPTGYLRLSNGRKPNVRRLRLVIASAWSPDKPLRIECIALR